jgi:ubiquinone biosynthesis protein COQ9
MALPENVGSSVRELARLADEMWYLAGDRSVDFSWYTKRATLSTVYASTGGRFLLIVANC